MTMLAVDLDIFLCDYLQYWFKKRAQEVLTQPLGVVLPASHRHLPWMIIAMSFACFSQLQLKK